MKKLLIIALFVLGMYNASAFGMIQEMQENGVGVNELQTQLLQKIEELTLYILQQEEIINDLNYRIQKLEE